MAQAERLRAAGQLAAAENLYRKVLDAAPDFHPAYHALGLLAYSAGKMPLAANLITRAIQLNGSTALYYRNLGEMLRRMGRLDEAIAAGRQGAALDPNDLDAHYNLALALSDKGEHATAVQSYRRALEIAPAHNLSWNNLGAALEKLGDRAGAELAYAQAVALNPQHAEALINLGMIHLGQDKLDAAGNCFKAAIAANPDFAEPYLHLGNIRKRQEKFAAALPLLRKARELRPDHVETLLSLGTVCQELKQMDEAERCYRRALELHPGAPGAYYFLASLLFKTLRLEEAASAYQHVLAANPAHAEAHNNLGFVYQELGRLEEAEPCYHRALAIQPVFAECRLHLALNYLLRGKFAEGWAAYRVRTDLKRQAAQRPKISVPEWQGEALAGRRLLLIKEQGFGDQIQFIRYARLLQEQGATVDALVDPELVAVLASAPGLRQAAADILSQDYDYWTLLLNVPQHLGTNLDNIPADIPYLHADAARAEAWRARLDAIAQGRRKIGVVWSGRPTHNNDHIRSMNLGQLAPLGALKNVAWFSLQKGASAAQLAAAPAGFELHDLGNDFKDFSDTAAAIEALDMVVSVDTSVVHLAGALGKPIWVFIPYNPDWRWMMEREDTPWYPSMRLFRQERLGDWTGAINKVAAALQLETGSV